MSSQKSTKPKKQLRITNPSGSSSFKGESSSKRDQVYNTVNVGLDVVANIAEGSDILGPLKAACRATKSVLDVVQAIESNKEEWTDLTRRLKSYMSTLEERIDLFEGYPLKDRAVDEAFSQPLIHYVEFLESMHDTVVEIQEKRSRNRLGFLKSFSKVKIDAGEIRKLNRDIEDGHRQFMEALSHFTALRIQAVEQNTKVILTAVDASAILQLPTVAFVASSLHSTCLKGTREAVLQTIWRWADDDTSDKPIFWLCDIAGSGKSTVAMSAVESWRQQGVLGGRFFFSIASSEGSTTDKFCSTIARDLVEYLPELAPHVAGAVKQHPSFMRSSLEEQFQNLVANPLHHWQGRVFIVIDALDECKSGSQRRELVETLSKAVRGNKTLRIFMTSRPDPVVQAVLGSLSIKSKLEDRLHDITHRDNIGDIALYVHQSLDGVLSEDKRRRLIDKANGLFIWASTACRMLTNETSLVPTETMYNRLISMDQVGAIDDLYGLIFERTEPGNHEIMYKMLALLLAAFEPLTTDDLDDILNYTGVLGSAKALVRNLGSVLTEDSTTRMVQFRHPTLVEYLRRCSNTPNIGSRNRVYISIANAHGQAASWCFKCLESRTEGLKFNICQIESSFNLNREIPNLDAKISTLVPRRLRYASFHWLFHMAEADNNWQSTLKDNLRHIIQVQYVLYWMEILSLTGGISRAITGLRAITSWTGLEEETRSRMDEIRRFILAFSVPIQDSAPHIYISALPFTPTKSKLHIEGLNKYTNTLKVCRGLEEMYPGLPTTLRGHEDWVYSVAFSPDSSQIVSGSDDKTIRLWDTVTGQPLGEPLQGHEAGILSVAFSPDGSQIVSGSEDQNIRLWDTSTGQPLGEPLRGHYGSIRSVIFSPDGSKIVSGSDDKTIRLWDAATGQSLRPPLQGHDDAITSVVLSPDGSQIVSSSDDKTIRIWDTATGQPLREPLRGHSDWVNSIALSPDGSCIVSGSEDKTIRLWSTVNGQPLGEPLQGHNRSINSVTFSPDGSQIISGDSDGMIRRWETGTGQPLGEPLRGHGTQILCLAFSSDGSKFVSSSSGQTIKLWNAVSGQPMGDSPQGDDGLINSVAFSPHGSQIVSASSDMTIRLWDTVTGQPLGEPFRGHDSWISSVAFSPDGTQIVSGSDDKTIRIWNAATFQLLGEPLRGHDGTVNSVAFSPDGSQIVSGSDDQTIRLWDTATGSSLGESLRGHNGWISSVAFSSDGSQIVSSSSDKTIRLWDTATGQPLGKPLRGHSGFIDSVAFSPDGSRIVSGSSDKTIRIWDTATGQPLGEPSRGHDDLIYCVAFSPDGSQIASGSRDNTIRLWDAVTGQPMGEPLRGHTGRVSTVAFSPDGLRIASGSFDRTIRLWDVDTGHLLGEPVRDYGVWVNSVTLSSDGSQRVSGCLDEVIRFLDGTAGANINDSSKDVTESTLLSSRESSPGTPLRISVPGFEQCSLSRDGWVHSSGKRLFWVPPDNRHGLQYPRFLLTMPTSSPFRATKLDFTHFQCGPSWTNVRKDVH